MGKLITDAAVRAAQREVANGKKLSSVLSDASPRGTGKLILVVTATGATWFARRFVDGKPRKESLGRYPDVSLAEARRVFQSPETATSETEPEPAAATVAEVFGGYLDTLRATGKPSVKQIQRILDFVADQVGADKPAGSITSADIVDIIRPIYERGARVQADKFRMYIGAAYRWAMKAQHDYRVTATRDWGVTSNPVDAVPRDTEAEGVGNRWLSWEEYDQLMAFLLARHHGRTPVDKALLLSMLTGQRITEILKLTPAHWNSTERLLTWETTKNGLPHVLPVCQLAAKILNDMTASAAGWYFPNESGPDQHMPHGTVRMRLKRYAVKHAVPTFTTRDLRRTWKTLAGEAGLTKVERDALQNHTASDVSSKHYDRYDGLREKRAAVAKWEQWLAEKTKARR